MSQSNFAYQSTQWVRCALWVTGEIKKDIMVAPYLCQAEFSHHKAKRNYENNLYAEGHVRLPSNSLTDKIYNK